MSPQHSAGGGRREAWLSSATGQQFSPCVRTLAQAAFLPSHCCKPVLLPEWTEIFCFFVFSFFPLAKHPPQQSLQTKERVRESLSLPGLMRPKNWLEHQKMCSSQKSMEAKASCIGATVIGGEVIMNSSQYESILV